MSYMKEEFGNWIKSSLKSNGKSYSRETISGYIASLRSHACKLTDIHLDYTDLFNIDNISEFTKVYSKFTYTRYTRCQVTLRESEGVKTPAQIRVEKGIRTFKPKGGSYVW